MLLSSIIPWKPKRLDVATPSNMWAFNPSIVRYRGRTLCSVRLANYHMPGARPSIDNPPRPSSRCVMVELDDQLNVMHQCTIDEHDLGSREDDRSEAKRISKGFEDYRLFVVKSENRTMDGSGGENRTMGDSGSGPEETLYASASSACTCPSTMAVIEVAHLTLRETELSRWELASASPLRGEWSRAHQKNWMPYLDHPSGEPRWLYSIDRGGVHSTRGRVVAQSTTPRSLGDATQAPAPRALAKFSPVGGNRRSLASSNGEVMVFGRKRVRAGAQQQAHGRVDHPLRGGTQLVKVPGATATWIGLAHGYHADGDRKFYWHAWIAVDENGELRGASRPFKLCNAGIEFAAGLVIDETSRQVAVSYGVDDDSAWIGVSPLGDVLGMLPSGAIV